MSKKTITAYASMFVSVLSNNNVTRGLLSSVGIATTGDSDSLVNVMDKLTGNYNYLDSLNYDEDSQTITMSNDNGSVDKLREEIKQYYYDLIGLCQWPSSGTVKSFVDSSEYRKNFEYEEDYHNAYYINSKYCIASSYANYALFFDDKFDYMYLSNSEKKNLYYDGWYYDFYKLLYRDGTDFSSKLVSEDKKGLIIRYNVTPLTNVSVASLYYHNSYPKRMALCPSFIMNDNGTTSDDTYVKYYSYDNTPLMFFKSYSAYYNFINGDQNAYLSSKIEETGKDISYSIKDMNENLGTKMDELIDSINSGKGNMTQDELQNAIDKGLEDLNKNTEDIKDNTSSILEKLEEQNQILLQILGVTEFIAYQEVKENSDQYNMSYLKTLLDSMFTGLFNALMYGENTVDDKNTDTASMQSFSVSNAAAPVAVYSDDIAVYDSGGSGGGSSFGGGSDSSGGHFFDLKNGLFGKFPFSIPYQCYNWLQILQRDPKAPTFTLDYGYLFGCSGDPKFVLSFDLSRYNDIAEVGRSFCRLFMTLMLALGIYHKNKGEM